MPRLLFDRSVDDHAARPAIAARSRRYVPLRNLPVRLDVPPAPLSDFTVGQLIRDTIYLVIAAAIIIAISSTT
jgi:hypothetical protein